MKQKIILIIFLFISFNFFAQNIDFTEIELNFDEGSNPKNFTKGINKIYFSADDGINGTELWMHNILTNSTQLVKNIGIGSNPGFDNPKFITIGDTLYFAPDYANGTVLWRSDGTEAGTYLIKEISNTSFNTINNIFVYNGNLIFTADDTINGNEIWISDGTNAGTTILKDINPGAAGSHPTNFTIFNNLIYFTATTSTNGRELWKTDGTSIETQLVIDINSNNSDSIQTGGNFIVLNNSLFFYANGSNANGYELWKSDGTAFGTQLFKDITVGSNSSNQVLIGAHTNNYFIFVVNSSTIGTELWISDGTISGTNLLKDINPGAFSSINYTIQFAILNNSIFFTAKDYGNNTELWKTDGTTIGTNLVKDINIGPNASNITSLTATSNYLIFSALADTNNYNTLWKSDGSAAGTFELKNTNLTQFSNTNLTFVELNNLVFFPAGYNSLNGRELWTTDGTAINTKLFLDIFHKYNGMTDFYDVAKLGDKLIFTGNNGNGFEPFVTDGTVNGSHIIKDVNPGDGSAFFTSSGYRSASYTKAGNYVFFRAIGIGSGYEIWRTDGTEANTIMVKDIRPGNASSISESPLFMEHNGIFYFKANDGVHGDELWRSDGTEIGTYMVKDIYVGPNSSLDNQSNIFYNHPDYLNEKCYAILNGYLYFVADDGINKSVWRTDGTNSGTIKAIIVPSGGIYDWKRAVINATNNKIFFKTNTTNSSYGDNTLWSSDGTQSGTTLLLVSNIVGPTQFKKNIVHNSFLYFTLYTNTGCTLYKTDGTTIGTSLVITNFTNYQTFNALISCGDYVYFTVGEQNGHGKELWRTNGTTLGTIKIDEIPLSTPENFIGCNTCKDDNLLFIKTNFGENKIYFVNGNSISTNDYLTANIINAENFGVNGFFSFSNLYEFNDKLLLAATKQLSGMELYSSEFDFTLNTQDYNQDLSDQGIILYPNPSKEVLYIKTNDDSIIKNVKIFDLLGKEVFFSSENKNELNVSNINQGIYLIKVFTDKSTVTKKFIIKK